ncbi:MAG: flagellar motor switch protein FliG [Treponema sp.]|nr:flagellar motor switch protein FliG [Treponema sp.]
MNLNDLRAGAYGKQSTGGENKSSDGINNQNDKKSNVKAFQPVKLTKEQVQNNNQGISSFKPVSFNDKKKQETWTENSSDGFQKVSDKTLKASSQKSIDQRLDSATDYLKNNGLLKVPVESPDGSGKDSVYRRVAKFLVLIGEDEAAKILPHLNEKQIEKIIPEIASIRTVSKDEAAVIMAEFNGLLQEARKSGGIETAREILQKAYGKDKADLMLNKAVVNEGKRPFDYLHDADNERIYLLLKDENVGVQSLVLSFLEPKKSAAIINLMKPAEKRDVVLRLAKMEPVNPDILKRVDKAMHEKSLNQTVERAENIDGRNVLAQILKKMDIGTENDILEYLTDDDPDLGQDLRSRLFTSDDVINADDRFIQEKLRDMTERDIAYLIAGKTDDFRDKILDNISQGRRTEVLTQEEILKPMRKIDCERITSEFFSVLRRAYEQGHLIIKNRSDDIFV